MKKLLLVLLALPLIGFGQQTYVPDNNFEAYLEQSGMGNGIPNDDYVTTANINTVTYLDVMGWPQSFSDLTGIEAFTALTHLNCCDHQLTSLDVSQNAALTYLCCHDNQLTSLNLSQNTALTTLWCNSNQLTSLNVSGATALTNLECVYNQLSSLNVSQNTALTWLSCDNNQLTSLNVSQNTALIALGCGNNQLTSLDVSQNTALIYLGCNNNQLSSLNVSQNTALTYLYCSNNQLTSLDVRNGNNTNFIGFLDANGNAIPPFSAYNNPNLTCINVDDAAYSTNNWTDIDSQQYFSNNCPPSAIQEQTTNKELLKVTDLLGRETKATNQLLFYIYNDGTVDKKIIKE